MAVTHSERMTAMAARTKLKTIAEIKADLGVGASRRGQCNDPHPDPKYVTVEKAPVVDIATKKPILDQYGLVVLQDVDVATVTCSRFAGHPAGDEAHPGGHAAYAFAISELDRW